MASGVVMDKGGGGGSNADVWRRGKKRVADESNLTDLERFEKRLRLLSLREQDHDRRQQQRERRELYTPVSNHEASAPSSLGRRRSRRARDANNRTNGQEDQLMQVDDRPDRVYIHDLDAELASSSDSESEKLIFLPDIEKRFSRIPEQILNPTSGDSSQEMVLYSVPKSISVDEGHDSVRKAILETRARARERALEEAMERQEVMERQYESSGDGVERAHGFSSGYGNDDGVGSRQAQEGGWQVRDEDAMDID